MNVHSSKVILLFHQPSLQKFPYACLLRCKQKISPMTLLKSCSSAKNMWILFRVYD